MFVNKLTDSDGEATETQVWLDFSFDCGYMSRENRDRFTAGYEEVGKMLSGMMNDPGKFAPRACESCNCFLLSAFCLLLFLRRTFGGIARRLPRVQAAQQCRRVGDSF